MRQGWAKSPKTRENEVVNVAASLSGRGQLHQVAITGTASFPGSFLGRAEEEPKKEKEQIPCWKHGCEMQGRWGVRSEPNNIGVFMWLLDGRRENVVQKIKEQ